MSLHLFPDMKDNLKISLERQWKTEQTQKEQIAALAHDLKTPLTVIQGNADYSQKQILMMSNDYTLVTSWKAPARCSHIFKP